MRVQIVGVDETFRDVDVDVSVSGLYLEIDREIGELGSVQRLRLGLIGERLQLTVLARIARIATSQDFWRGPVVEGVAFEFMFQQIESDAAPETIPIDRSSALREFVRLLARDIGEHETQVDHVWQAMLESPTGPEREATVNGVSLFGTVLETDFPVPIGELIKVEIPGLERRIPLSGFAVESELVAGSDGKRYRTSVKFNSNDAPLSDGSSGGSLQEALGALLSTSERPSDRASPRRQHLAGDLSRISLASVLTVCELERASGVLCLRSELEEVRCYLHEGRMFDVECDGRLHDDVRTLLTPVLARSSGSFEFLFGPMTRPDRIGMTINALLLTLAHSIDEASR
jgi:hypothetical protein